MNHRYRSSRSAVGRESSGDFVEVTMKKKHQKHDRPVAFAGTERIESAPFISQEKALTAEGYRRRILEACPTRSRSLYRGRRQGKGK